MYCSHEKSFMKNGAAGCCAPVRHAETAVGCCRPHDSSGDNDIKLLRHRLECFKSRSEDIELKIKKLTIDN